MTEPLSPEALDGLLAVLEVRAGRTATGFRRVMPWIAALFLGMALLYGIYFGWWAVAGFIAAFGVLLVVVFVTAARRTSPERMAPVLAALRDAPGEIVLVRHYQTSDSHHLFVSHWIEVKTADHRLLVKADQDWQVLLDQLSRRCPQAQCRGR